MSSTGSSFVSVSLTHEFRHRLNANSPASLRRGRGGAQVCGVAGVSLNRERKLASLKPARRLAWLVVGAVFCGQAALAASGAEGLRLSLELEVLPALRAPLDLRLPSDAVLQNGDGFAAAPFRVSYSELAASAPHNSRTANPYSLARLFKLGHVPVGSSISSASFRSGTEVVDDLELGQALRLAVEFSRDVRIAGTQLDAARAQTGQAVSLLLPSLSVRNSRGRETSSPSSDFLDPPTNSIVKLRDTHTRTDTTAVLRQPLFDLPGVFEVIRRKDLERSRELSLRSSEGEAALGAVQAYVALASTRLQADLAMEFENQLKDLREYLRKRADAGASTVSDLDRVRARVLTAYAARLEQESAHAAAAIEFTRLANVVPRKIKLPVITELGQIPGDFDQAISLATDLNPDIASLRAGIEAAENDRIAAKAGVLPKIDFELSDFRVNNAGGNTGLQNDRRLMLVANWALFDGGRTLKLTDERQARKDEAVLRLDDTQRRLVQSLSAQYAALATVRGRIDLGYAEYEVLQAALAAVSERMLSGNQSLLDLLDVYERVYQVRSRLVNLHVQEFTAAAQIIRNIYGSGSNDPAAAATLPAK